jgi:hypothetical protein
LKFYKFLDDVWTFVLEDAQFKFDGNLTVNSSKTKIVATGKRLGATEKKEKKSKTEKAEPAPKEESDA